MSGHTIGILFVLAAVLGEAISQLALKHAADGGRRWIIIIGIVFFAVQAGLFTIGLHYLDLSVANPLGSLVFVMVAVLARLFLGERLSTARWAGIGLIVAGTVLVGWG